MYKTISEEFITVQKKFVMNGGMGLKINVNEAFAEKMQQIELMKQKISQLSELLAYQKKVVQELIGGNKQEISEETNEFKDYYERLNIKCQSLEETLSVV